MAASTSPIEERPLEADLALDSADGFTSLIDDRVELRPADLAHDSIDEITSENVS